MNRRKKRRRRLLLVVIILILICLIFMLGEFVSKLVNGSKSKAAISETKGNVTFTENQFYKKYTINCSKGVKDINYKNKNGYIIVSVSKSYLDKIVVKDIKHGNADRIKINSAGNEISFKEDFQQNNFVYTDNKDSKKIVVILSKKQDPYKNKVILDAGHGGIDKGANVGNIYEKNINLDIVKYLGNELRYRGYKVDFTRESDKLLKLKDIGDIVNNSGDDIFISIHVNYNKDSSEYQGLSTYYYAPGGYQEIQRSNLAKAIQSQIVKSDGWRDRHILTANFAVLRYSKIPCVLVECGFLSNPQDLQRLRNTQSLRQLAINISEGIDNYYLLNVA